jgi:hypothetical protein
VIGISVAAIPRDGSELFQDFPFLAGEEVFRGDQIGDE